MAPAPPTCSSLPKPPAPRPCLPSSFPLCSFLVLLQIYAAYHSGACERLDIRAKGSEGKTGHPPTAPPAHSLPSWDALQGSAFSPLLSSASFLPVSPGCLLPPGSPPGPSCVLGAPLPAACPRACGGLSGPCPTPVLDAKPQGRGRGAHVVPLNPQRPAWHMGGAQKNVENFCDQCPWTGQLLCWPPAPLTITAASLARGVYYR